MAQTVPTRRLILAAGFFMASTLACPVLAAPVVPAAPLSPDDKALVDKAAAYLGGLSQAKGRFIQTDPRGQTSQGVLYLKRPGQARFAYDPPSNQLVVSDGYNVSIMDPRLKTFDRYPLGATPLSLFLARDVRLDKGVEVTRVTHFADGFSITARDARHPRAGEVTLTFSNQPVRLREWNMVDAQGASTRIRIAALEPASGLDPALFTLRDPRPPRAAGGHP